MEWAAFKGSCCLWSSSQWHHVSGFLVQRSVLQGPSARSVSAVCMHTLRRTSACYVSIGGGVELLRKGRKGLMVGRYLSVSYLCFRVFLSLFFNSQGPSFAHIHYRMQSGNIVPSELGERFNPYLGPLIFCFQAPPYWQNSTQAFL